MVRPTTSPKSDASIAISLEKAAFGSKTQKHVRISVCRRQFDPKPETCMLHHYESSLTYIKSEVWLLFFHLSTAAGLLPKNENLPNIFLSKVLQKVFMSSAVLPRFGTKNEGVWGVMRRGACCRSSIKTSYRDHGLLSELKACTAITISYPWLWPSNFGITAS
jgi:hypothetical protein